MRYRFVFRRERQTLWPVEHLDVKDGMTQLPEPSTRQHTVAIDMEFSEPPGDEAEYLAFEQLKAQMPNEHFLYGPYQTTLT
jgi:hypothetical protein